MQIHFQVQRGGSSRQRPKVRKSFSICETIAIWFPVSPQRSVMLSISQSLVSESLIIYSRTAVIQLSLQCSKESSTRRGEKKKTCFEVVQHDRVIVSQLACKWDLQDISFWITTLELFYNQALWGFLIMKRHIIVSVCHNYLLHFHQRYDQSLWSRKRFHSAFPMSLHSHGCKM